MFTSKWGESSQQHVFQEEPKVEGPRTVCYCLLQKDSFQEFSVDSPIYDSYISDNEKSIANFQEGWPIEKWVVKGQQQVFLEKYKVEEFNSICGYPDQEDIGRRTVYENEVAIKFPFQLYDPIADHMTKFLIQQQRLFQEHVSGYLFQDFPWCILALIFIF